MLSKLDNDAPTGVPRNQDFRSGKLALDMFLIAAQFATHRLRDIRTHGMDSMVNIARQHPEIIAPMAAQAFRIIAGTEPNDVFRVYALLKIETCRSLAPGISCPRIPRAPSRAAQTRRMKRFIQHAKRHSDNLVRRYMRRNLMQPKNI